jgi:hypothetical protein
MRAAPDAGELTASPVFALTVGPGAVKEPTLQLQGISITRQRTAALISIDGRPAEWLALGESRDGVTLESVQSSRVVIDTVLGAKDIALGEQVGPPPADAGAAPMVAAVTPDAPPPGVRSPPPPANAPRSP